MARDVGRGNGDSEGREARATRSPERVDERPSRAPERGRPYAARGQVDAPPAGDRGPERGGVCGRVDRDCRNPLAMAGRGGERREGEGSGEEGEPRTRRGERSGKEGTPCTRLGRAAEGRG